MIGLPIGPAPSPLLPRSFPIPYPVPIPLLDPTSLYLTLSNFRQPCCGLRIFLRLFVPLQILSFSFHNSSTSESFVSCSESPPYLTSANNHVRFWAFEYSQLYFNPYVPCRLGTKGEILLHPVPALSHTLEFPFFHTSHFTRPQPQPNLTPILFLLFSFYF